MGIKRIYIAIILLSSCAYAGKLTDSIAVSGGAELNRVYIDSVKRINRIDTAKATAVNVDRLYYGTQSGGNTVVDTIVYSGIFGDIYESDTLLSQTIPTGNVYTKLTGFGKYGTGAGVTIDTANDKLVILKAGKYRLSMSLSFGGTANTTFRGAAFLNNVEQDQIHFARKLGSGCIQ